MLQGEIAKLQRERTQLRGKVHKKRREQLSATVEERMKSLSLLERDSDSESDGDSNADADGADGSGTAGQPYGGGAVGAVPAREATVAGGSAVAAMGAADTAAAALAAAVVAAEGGGEAGSAGVSRPPKPLLGWKTLNSAINAFAGLCKVHQPHTFCPECGKHPRVLVSDGTSLRVRRDKFNPKDPDRLQPSTTDSWACAVAVLAPNHNWVGKSLSGGAGGGRRPWTACKQWG